MKTLIVTGAAGFIGSNFVRLALQEGYGVVGFDSLTYAGHRENLENLPNPQNFELIVEDIRSPEIGDLLQKKRPLGLVNFAAESHVDRSVESPLIFVETNVFGTANLLAHSLNYWKTQPNFRYLQVSTDEVYGSLGETGKFSEQSPLEPSSPYSASKAGADLLVQAWQKTYGLPAVITRCSNNYGPFQFPEKLIPHMIQCALEDKTLPVYGDGKNVRDWIHVEDHCRGILLALQKGQAGKVYCFGGNCEKRNIDLVKKICGILDNRMPKNSGGSYESQISFVKDRLGHDWRYAIDDSLARNELGFISKFSFESGLDSTVDWYLSHQSWCERVMTKKESR